MARSSKSSRKSPRDRARSRIRKRIHSGGNRPRISVFRSSKHTYAQIIVDTEARTIASASTLEKEVQDEIKTVTAALKAAADATGSTAESKKSVAAARAVGRILARRCKANNVDTVVFDRSGYVYKGRIQALADGAREEGLQF